LAAYWDGLAAADFFTFEVLTWRGLVRYVVFFVMKLKTRTVQIAGISDQPDGDWMTQIARNLTDAHDGFLRDVQYIILDRDPLYTATFRDLLRDSGVTPLRLPARSPNLTRLRSDLWGRSEPSVWRGSCHSAKGTSGPRCERSSITIMKNGRTKV
jgi:hypothetical protein